MTEIPDSGTGGLTEDQRRAALGRFRILRPYLEAIEVGGSCHGVYPGQLVSHLEVVGVFGEACLEVGEEPG